MDVSLPEAMGESRKVQPDSDALARGAAQGDAGAFGQLYDLHLDSVYRYVYYKVGRASEAEDLTSQIFLKAWDAMPRYRWREIPFSHWLMRLARNTVIDYYRTSRSHGEVDEALSSPEPDPQGQYLRDERDRGLQAALVQLPEEQRLVVWMRFIEGMDYAELAAMTGKSQGALRVIQHRALVALRRILEKEG